MLGHGEHRKHSVVYAIASTGFQFIAAPLALKALKGPVGWQFGSSVIVHTGMISPRNFRPGNSKCKVKESRDAIADVTVASPQRKLAIPSHAGSWILHLMSLAE